MTEAHTPIRVGDIIPSVILKRLTDNGVRDLSTDSVFIGKKVVVFAIPGAFTPTCTVKHMPGYLQHLQKFKNMGIDVACLSVNDPFVMEAWAKSLHAEGVILLADGNAALTRALGLEMDGSGYGLGIRSQRFALYAENGKVVALEIDKPGMFEVSSAEAMLKSINGLKAAA